MGKQAGSVFVQWMNPKPPMRKLEVQRQNEAEDAVCASAMAWWRSEGAQGFYKRTRGLGL
jgi:3-hydroxyacyl-CoA dehydrogenase